MKKRIDIIAQEESYFNLSTFQNVESLNETIRTYRDAIRASVKRADVQARLISLLEVLKRHSCKQVGVSYLKKNTIADMLEVSYKTVQRLMKKLADLGMIKQVSMKRKSDMLQTANAVVIQPAKDEVPDKAPAEMAEKCPTNKTTTRPLKQEILNKRNAVPSHDFSGDIFYKANYVPHWVPDRFASLLSYFYKDAATVQEFWKVIRQCNRVVNYDTGNRAFNADQELAIGEKAIKEFVMKVKAGARIGNIFGYFNGIVNNLMDKLFFDREFMGE